jgi:hypothetical protein
MLRNVCCPYWSINMNCVLHFSCLWDWSCGVRMRRSSRVFSLLWQFSQGWQRVFSLDACKWLWHRLNICNSSAQSAYVNILQYTTEAKLPRRERSGLARCEMLRQWFYALFNDDLSTSEHIASNVSKINGRWIRKNVGGNCCGLFQDPILTFPWRDWRIPRKFSVRIADFQA